MPKHYEPRGGKTGTMQKFPGFGKKSRKETAEERRKRAREWLKKNKPGLLTDDVPEFLK